VASSSRSTTSPAASSSATLDRSSFYRDKLADAGFGSAEAAGGLAEIAQLPLTEKDEIRATCTPDNPIGAHFCATPAEIVRIYSTSGTSGTPSYIPLTAGDLDNWVTGSARSYSASGVTAGQRAVSSYNAGPFVAGAAIEAFDRIGLRQYSARHGKHRAAAEGGELFRPEVAILTPSYAAYLIESSAAERELRSRRVERRARSLPASRAAASRRSARSSKRLGRQGHRGDGIGDIGVSLWGE
jgi:phenylacetate-CoA ligase